MKRFLGLVVLAFMASGCGSSSSDTPPAASADGSVNDVEIGDSTGSDGIPTDGPGPDSTIGPDSTPPSDAAPDSPAGPDSAPPADAAPDGPVVTKVTVVMGGDIAEQGRTQYARTNAQHMTSHDPAVSAVVLLGDNSRYSGTGTLLNHYNTYYKPASEANWGQFDPIAFPQLGNHEYTNSPQGYFDYFANRMTAIKALAGYDGFVDDTTRAYYSFDINGWHFVSLNSNCSKVSGGCGAGSAQEKWLKADLSAHASMPIVAAWHAPRWACGGSHPSDAAFQPFWADLYDAGADFVFVGHDHYYQRWKPLDKTTPNAQIDAAKGLTEIVAGSYGVSTYTVCSPADARIDKQSGGDAGMGVFYLTIGSDGSYSFDYQLQSDGSVFDTGAGKSHHSS